MPDRLPSPSSRPTRGLLLAGGVACALLLSGCGLRGSGGEAQAAASPGAAAGSTPPGSAEAAPPPRAEVLLEQGEALLIAGRHAEAIPALEAYLVVGEVPEHRLSASWALALAHLHPENPRRDPARARFFLGQIREEHPGTLQAVHATLLEGMVRDLSRTRATVEEQQRVIAELNQTVEQLKQIDLNRRPGGGGGGVPQPLR